MIYYNLGLILLAIHVSIAFARPASSAADVPSVAKTVADPTSVGGIIPSSNLAVPTSANIPTLSKLSSTAASASSSTTLASSNPGVHRKTKCLSGAPNVRHIKFVGAVLVTPPPLYAVTTQWTIHYPSQLRKAFEDAGFQIIQSDDPLYNKTMGCYWFWSWTYSSISVKRGTINVLGTDSYPTGVPEDITRIVNILKSTYPFTEITLILTFLVGIPVSFFGLCFCMGYDDSAQVRRAARLLAKRERRQQKRREQKKKENEIAEVDFEKLKFYPPTIGASRLLQLPIELHLEIISHLHYQELKTTRLTCRALHSLVPVKDLDLDAWRDYLTDREMARKRHQEIPCFHCLRLKPLKEFPLAEQNRQSRAHCCGGHLLPASSINLTRNCIDCTIQRALSTGGISPFLASEEEHLFVCGACGQQPPSQVCPAHHRMRYDKVWCNECWVKNAKILEHSWIRPLQTILALISFSISFTGA
jgi:hypothetical protein